MSDPEWACCHWPGRALRAEQELATLRAENARFRKALNEIASWDEGDTVTGSFDSPSTARIARKALEE